MRFVSILVLAAMATAPAVQGTVAMPTDDAAIAHVLDRLAFGPAAGQVERVRAIGLGRWVDEQLQPQRITDGALDARLARLQTLTLDSATIARDYFLPARRERRARQQAAADGGTAPREAMAPAMNDAIRQERRILTELGEAKLLRAVYSERQLEEVLVDFWFNHFNVFAGKGQTGIYLGEYEREAIRPHVLGKFRDLLGATAKSPAMLFYLDNWQSVAVTARAGRDRPTQARRGLNENYARELLELHTLGVDGGYTQQDIIDVARAFTGWTIGRPDAAGFRFAANLHDRGAKGVLGLTLPAGRGIDDGERVLDLLAQHPATARHIAFKLAQRFVSDAPPAPLVDRAANTFQRTKGDLREVVRRIVTSPEFFDRSARRAKVKTPFEFVASALRATGAEVRNGQAVIRALADMGMPLYLCQPPTGYDDTAAAWVSSGALITRINFAVALTRGEIRGVELPKNGRESAEALRLGGAEFQRQ
jgi:uncharacterized protein (DUF1800 family)